MGARTNYQSLFGADVISRIQYSMESVGKLKALQGKVIGCCNDILSELCERNAIEQKLIYDATMVGNTTMSHLVFGVTPASMALLSDAERGRADLLALSTEHIELSMNPTFQDYYIDAMTFRK